LPREAWQVVLHNFEADAEPRLISARKVDPLPEDQAVAAQDVWCVNVAYIC
jgi:hypothetical protein